MSPLTIDERRALFQDARDVVKFVLSHALPKKGVSTSNFNTWVASGKTTLAETKQLAAMTLLGFSPYGQLLSNCTHQWPVLNPELLEKMKVLLERERKVREVRIAPAYTNHLGERIFVGVEVNWVGPFAIHDGVKERAVRLCLTAGASFADEEFVQSIVEIMREKATAKREVTVMKDMDVMIDAAIRLWRCDLKLGGRNPIKPDARTELLPADQDMKGHVVVAESPIAVLEDMTRRFDQVAHELADRRKTRLGPRDQGLLNRARKVLQHQVEGSR